LPFGSEPLVSGPFVSDPLPLVPHPLPFVPDIANPSRSRSKVLAPAGLPTNKAIARTRRRLSLRDLRRVKRLRQKSIKLSAAIVPQLPETGRDEIQRSTRVDTLNPVGMFTTKARRHKEDEDIEHEVTE
jgi:hypothetical protein